VINVSVDIKDLLDAKDIKKLYQLSKSQRARLNRKLGRLVIKQTKKRIRTQRDIRGGELAKRQKGSKKVLKSFARGLTVFAGPNKSTVTWKNALKGSIAYKHHNAIPELWTAAKLKRLYGEPDYTKPATREQARSLLAVGFKVEAKNGKTKRPSQKWIMENMTIGVAGKELRKIAGKPSKQAWLVPTKKRQVLGAEQADIQLMADLIIKSVTQKPK